MSSFQNTNLILPFSCLTSFNGLHEIIHDGMSASTLLPPFLINPHKLFALELHCSVTTSMLTSQTGWNTAPIHLIACFSSLSSDCKTSGTISFPQIHQITVKCTHVYTLFYTFLWPVIFIDFSCMPCIVYVSFLYTLSQWILILASRLWCCYPFLMMNKLRFLRSSETCLSLCSLKVTKPSLSFSEAHVLKNDTEAALSLNMLIVGLVFYF